MSETSSGALPAAIARWRAELITAAGRDALVDYRDLPTGTLDLSVAHPSGLAQFLAGRPTRLSSLFREPEALSAARKRARAIRLAATRLADQHGVGGSYLASGMVSWRPDPMQPPVQAPVLLRSLALRPRGAGQVDDDLDLGIDVRANPALIRLLAAYGVRVDATELEGLATGEHGFNPRPALSALRDLAGHLTGFTVTERTVIGIFVDVVPALLADLDELARTPSLHSVVTALAVAEPGPVARAPGPHGQEPDGAGPDGEPVPFEVLDLDADQRRVLATVSGGGSAHVTAPPGSGATRLLTQLVVSEAGQGRRVLLVTTQRAEAAGVVDGLESLGLAELVSDPGGLLTGYRRRRATADPMPDTGNRRRPEPGAAATALTSLAEQRQALHRVVDPWGVSVSGALHALARLSSGPRAPRTAVRLDRDAAAALAGEERATAATLLRQVADLGAFEPAAQDSPWHGARLTTEAEAVEALAAAERLVTTTVPELRAEMARVAAAAGLAGAGSVAEWGRQIDLLVAVRATLDVFTPAVYERSVADMIAATASAEWRDDRERRMSALERRRWRKQARDLLRPGSHPADLNAALVRAQAERLAWQQHATGGGWPRVPAGLAETEAAYAAVLADLSLLDAALATDRRRDSLLDAPLEQLERRLTRLAATDEVTATLPARVAATSRLRQLGLDALLDDLLDRRVPAPRVVDELELCWWASVLEHVLTGPAAPGADGASTDDLQRVRQEAWAATADTVRDVERSRAEASCTVVSPLSLPQLVPAGQRYDLVVLAGAHRCAVPEGVLAMSRGRRLLVIGDPAGLPPADLDLVPEEPAPGSVPEPRPARMSVLSATTGVLPGLGLTHQHRMPTQLTALAAERPAWSVPAADGGVKLELVEDGTGRPDAEGGVESVDAEVRRVVDLVLEHARHRPDQSLGVLAVTRHHARRIADAVRAELGEHPDVAPYFMRPGAEPFVVTDLPRCEDAVRDAVILTVGLGRTTRGRVLHRFGPLDNPGGEQALAVAATRARRSVTVVSCFAAGDLDADKLKTPGAQALHDLLAAAAAAGSAAGQDAGRGDKLGPLLDDLANRLHHKGFDIDPGDHRPGWPDLAVRSHDGLPVAVLTDSRWQPDADAAAARALVTDDLAVAEHLRRFGWQVLAVTSLDLFTDADAVVGDVSALAGSTPAAPPGRRPPG